MIGHRTTPRLIELIRDYGGDYFDVTDEDSLARAYEAIDEREGCADGDEASCTKGANLLTLSAPGNGVTNCGDPVGVCGRTILGHQSMRLTDVLDKDNFFRYLLGFVFAVVFLIVVALPARTLGTFYGDLEELSESVDRKDFEQAQIALDEVTAFYERSRGWGLEWFADAYLFQDAFMQQAAYNYLTGNYEAVVRDLADEVDNSQASHVLASAKFQLARQRYRAIADDNPDGEALKRAIVQEVIKNVNVDYERALRSDETDRFDFKWNYDLTSDPEATRRALESLRKAEPPEMEQIKGAGTPVRRRRG